MNKVWEKQFVLSVSIFLCVVLTAVQVQALALTPGNGNGVEQQIYEGLKDHYQGSLQRIEGTGGAESYLQLVVNFEKQQLPDIILVVNVLNRSLHDGTGKVDSNIIQLQVFPQVQPLSPEKRASFMAAVTEWQYSHVLPQFAYLNPENHVVYGWGVPLYSADSLQLESLAQIIDELASLWIEFGGFLTDNIGNMVSLTPLAGNSVQNSSAGEEGAVASTLQGSLVKEVYQKPTYTLVETLRMLPGGRGMRPESHKRFTTFVESLKDGSAKRIIVRGYVSSDRDNKENQLLSRKRAERVAQMMLDAGVDPSKVSAEGMGIQNPVASNLSSEGRDQNRRVEIFLQD